MLSSLLKSSAIALALAVVAPSMKSPDIFLYVSSAHAQGSVPQTLRDGSRIPDWIKGSCCGPGDAHKLRADQVHRPAADYYTVDGYVRHVPAGQAQPSQDADYWIFYRDDGGGVQSGVYCFFVPMEF